MTPQLKLLLERIKDELDSEQMDESHVDVLFHKLRESVESEMSKSDTSEAEKADVLTEVGTLLRQYEKEAQSQKERIQNGLKKLSKGRRSMKEYNKNV
ncbi:hypothetical protein V6D52_03250 [Idiomarina loihiensis]|uniref:hypothetical protein n=1 Tax=Idiomarina loihiensis TaxID=135577 RepID=UPI000E7D55CE|nr:hypothetical protein [Idiomarina loihiensis]